MQSLAQTGHIVSTIYLVLVCTNGSNAALKSAPERAGIRNKLMNVQHRMSNVEFPIKTYSVFTFNIRC
jgi:hypothetical protein